MHGFASIPRWRLAVGAVASAGVVVGAVAMSHAAASPAIAGPAAQAPVFASAPGPAVPAEYARYTRAASACPGLDPVLLVAIHDVETRRADNGSTSVAGAVGPMQFLPSTWAHYGRDGDGDGVADAWDLDDALAGATALLCANDVVETPDTAIWNYNHSWTYVGLVQQRADALRSTGE